MDYSCHGKVMGQLPGPLNLAKQQRRGFYFQFILGLFHLGHISWFCLFSDVLITSGEVVCVYIGNSKCISWDTIKLKNWWIDDGHHINQVDGFEIMTIMLSSLQKTASDKDGQTICSLYVLSSPRAKRAGPKGLRAESARAVTGRRCPHSGVG